MIRVEERIGVPGFRVMVPQECKSSIEEMLEWLDENKAVLDRSAFPAGLSVVFDAISFESTVVIYVREITDEKRMLFKLTFC